MTAKRPDPVAAADDTARALARRLIGAAHHGSLATFGTGDYPGVSLIALAPAPEGGFLTLVSALAGHYGALRAKPKAALLIGEPGKGDPLAHPRLMIEVRATFLAKDSAAHQQAYLAHQPKAGLYIGFADFDLVHLAAESAVLNGGFGRAWRLTPQDL